MLSMIIVVFIVIITNVSSSSRVEEHSCSDKIKRSMWAERRELDVPHVFSDATKNWTFLDKWRYEDDYIFKKMPHILTNVYTSNDTSAFYYGGESQTDDMLKTTFESRLRSNGPPFVYYSGALSHWPDLDSDVSYNLFRQFCVRLDDCVSPQIWISEKDVVTRAHYDAAHNFFTQIRGRKRFDLWPPSAHKALHLHSSLSPFARQSQLDDIDLPSPHFTVTLSPGVRFDRVRDFVSHTHAYAHTFTGYTFTSILLVSPSRSPFISNGISVDLDREYI